LSLFIPASHFAAHFLTRFRLSCSIGEQSLVSVLPEFRQPGCGGTATLLPGALPMFNGTFIQAFIADSGMNFVQWVTQHFSRLSISRAHFCLNLQAHVVMFSLQFSGIQKPTSQGTAKPCDGKWGSSN